MDSQAEFESLSSLLQTCGDYDTVNYEAAWREFLSRYKLFLYRCVYNRCCSWRVSRLNRQLSDTVNDILSDVLIILTKSITQYREVENEPRFRLWLGTICNRAAGRYLQRRFYDEIAEDDLEEVRNYIRGVSFESRWELYESVVAQLRSTASMQKKYIERDINIFMLYTWSDFSQPMIQSHPCCNDIGHRVIDNVVNRARMQLRS